MSTQRALLFVQGGGAGAHDEWDNKLVESLERALGEGFEIHYPRMPREEDPHYAPWKKALEEAIARLPEGAILVGHSIGATMLLNLLAERRAAKKPAAVFLIAAPFVGEGGWSADELRLPSDLAARLPGDVPFTFFHGLADEVAPPSHLDLYARALPRAKVHRLPDRDHQLNGDLREVAAAISSLSDRS